jgi:hypothetical protein
MRKAQQKSANQMSFEDYLAALAELEASLAKGRGFKKGQPRVPDNFQRETWSEDEMAGLHLYLLEKSLLQLKGDKCSPKTREEVIAWVSVPLDNHPIPFSFQLCCSLAGCDPEKMQDMVLALLPEPPASLGHAPPGSPGGENSRCFGTNNQ